MSNTRIVLNRQSDLILTNATITNPDGLVMADISGLDSAVTSIDTNVSNVMSTEVSNRISGDASLKSSMESADSAEASSRVSGDESLASNLSTEVTNRQAAVSAEESRSVVAETSLQNNISAEASLRVVGDESVAAVLSTGDASLASTFLLKCLVQQVLKLHWMVKLITLFLTLTQKL